MKRKAGGSLLTGKMATDVCSVSDAYDECIEVLQYLQSLRKKLSFQRQESERQKQNIIKLKKWLKNLWIQD